MLQSQMTWVLGNFSGNVPTEIFALQLRTPAPITGYDAPASGRAGGLADEVDEAEGTLPRTLEAWIRAQERDEDFQEMLEGMQDKARKEELWINAPDGQSPTIIVPKSCQEMLVRDTHQRMFHLAHAKVYAFLRRSYTWPTIKRDVRVWLNDCPACDLNKARQNTAHGLFSALPVHAPRARWCMDFQGQGLARTGETEALALIDPTSRYVVVIPLANREAKTWIQPFLDRIIFTFGVPDTLHSDAAPEFLSEALELLSKAADIQTTTTLAHNARGNGTIEVFWRFWNRCLRLLSDEHYQQWPAFASRITFAYITAAHEGIGGVTPFEVYHGAPARNPLTASLLENETEVDEDKELCLPEDFAAAVAVSTKVFTQLAKTHDQFVRHETATRLNEKGSAKTFAIGDKVKVRVPPTAAQMEETGRRAKHITAWRGPCTIVERLSQTAYAAVDDVSNRRYERVLANLLPYRAKSAKTNANASFSQLYSDPFTENEFIAIRDSPKGPWYIAKVLLVTRRSVQLHYYGTTSMILSTAVFKPCWHEVGSDAMILSWDSPENEDKHPQFVDYNGQVDLKDINTVLVARQIVFTKAGKLSYRSLRALAPFHDQLFRFDR
jgi:transposase InsO family protein